MEELVRKLLGDFYKMPTTEVDALLNADTYDESAALTAIKGVIQKREKSFSGKFQEGVNKGYKDAKTEVETALKTTFGIDEGETFDEIVSKIQEQKAAEVTTPDLSKLTTEDLKKLPQFQQIAREHKTEVNKLKTESEARIGELEKAHQQEKIFTNVSKVGLDELNALNPVLPKNATAAEKQKSSFLNEFKQYDWAEQDGELVAFEKGTQNLAMDQGGNVITAKDFGRTKAAEWFDFAENNGGGNGGNGKAGQQGGNPGANGKVPTFKTFDELAKYTNDPSVDAALKQQALNAWDEAHQS